MNNNLNLFLIENKSKIKNNLENVDEKLISVKQNLKSCLDFIIKYEEINEQDTAFLRQELLNFLKSYININIQIEKKNEKFIIVNQIINSLVDNVLCSVDVTNNHKELKKEIKLLKKERNKTPNIVKISKSH